MKPTQEQALDWAFECDFVESSPAEDVFSAIYVCCPKDIERLVILAYDAGRAALAQPEPEKSLSQRMREAGFTPRDTRLECDGCGKKFSRLMLPIHDCDAAQPEPEPVAWYHAEKYSTHFTTEPSTDLIGKYWKPLYTAPREWVGLTDEEIREFELWLDDEEEKHGWNPPADIVKYLEAKLKEKNT